MACNSEIEWSKGGCGGQEWIRLTDIAYGQRTEMAQEGCIGNEGGNEDERNERRGPCWDFVGANSYRRG